MKALFISGYGGWGRKFCLIGETLLKNKILNEYMIYTHGIEAYMSVRNSDFNYKQHLNFENIYKSFLEEDSFPSAKLYESKYGSLYKMALSDRHLLQFTHDFPFGDLKDLDFITNYTTYLISCFEKILTDSKTEVVITSVVANISTLIISKVCEKLEIPYFNIASTRFPDRFVAYRGHFQREIVEISPIEDQHIQSAKKLVNSFIKGQSKPSWVGSGPVVKKLSFINIASFIKRINPYKFYRKTFLLDDFNDPLIGIPPISSRIKIFFLKNKRKNFYNSLKFINDISDLDFYFYPLHVDPEASTSVLAPEWIDQLDLIKKIRINMPAQKQLLVKEHPAMIGYRDESFYKRISRIPGVSFVKTDIDSFKLISYASLTVTITGTAAFEASLLKRNSFQFGKTNFSDLPGIHCFNGDIETLNEQFKLAEDNDKFDENSLIHKLAFNFANSMDLDYISAWRGEKNEDNLVSNYSEYLEKVFSTLN